MNIIKIFNFLKREKKQAHVNLGYNSFYRNKFIKAEVNNEMYKNFAISSCFDEIVRSFKTLEFDIYQNKNENYIKSKTLIAKKLRKTIKRPNPYMSFSMFIESYLTSVYFAGNCLVRKVKGVISDDLYIYSNGYYKVERFENNLMIKSIKLGNIIFEGKSLHDIKLISEYNYTALIQGVTDGLPKTMCLEPIKKLINGTLAYNISVLTNGGSVGGMMSFECDEADELTDKEKERIKDEFKTAYSGAGNAGKYFLSWKKVNYTPTGTVPKDLDYINSLKEMQKIVCRKMGVPETLIIGDNSSYNNTLEFKKKLYTELIIPLAKEFCEHLTELFKNELGEDEEFYFSTSSIKVLQNDMAKEIKDLVDSLTGICTVNNIIKIVNDKYQLELEDLGDKGDIVLTKYNFSLEDVGYVDSQTTPNTESDSGE